MENTTTLTVRVDRIKFFGNMLRFQLSIETDDPDYRDPSFTVIRIYQDFAWLNDKLRDNKEYLGISLPKLPPKLSTEENRDHFGVMESSLSKLSIKSQEKFEEELAINKSHEMELCKKNHQHYLDELIGHPSLRKDPYLKIFLEYRDFLKGVVKHKKNTLYREMDGLVESCLNTDLEKYGLDRFQEVHTECLHLREVLQMHSVLTDSWENLCYSLAGFCIHLQDMAERTAETWGELAWGMWSLKEETQKANQSLKEVFMGRLFNNYGFANAQKYLILARYHGQLEYNDLKHDIHRAEKHRHDTTQLVKDLEAQQQHLESLDETIIPELERLKAESEASYKSVLSVLSSSQLASSQAIETDLRESIARLSEWDGPRCD